jgi:membrane-associated protease RseP (regulator of RpoE activity)
MGSTSSEQSPIPVPAEPWPGESTHVPPVPRERTPRQPDRPWRFLFLLAATIVSTTWAGFLYSGSWTLGAAYSASILAILGVHEMGHYLACRYYGVDASLPYFLPMPVLLTGTLGAFIRIREQIPGKRQLFDIGIAGPIAGFLVAIPILLIGIDLSEVVRIEPGGVWLGEPILLKAAVWVVHGPLADGYTINTHPVAFAAWFGLLATAINLFPIGQLDGGHISYAVLGPRSTHVTIAGVLALIGLSFVSSAWIVWAVLTILMLLAFGPRHPRTVDEDVPLDPARLWLAGFALVMLIVCFTPVPIELLDLAATGR